MTSSALAQAAPPLRDLLAYADRCRTEGRLIEAEASCLRVLEDAPAQPDAHHQLGLVAHQRGKLADAVEWLQKAVTHAPENGLYRANLTEMLRQAGRFRAAAEEGRKAAKADPGLKVAWSNLGAALFELKHTKSPPKRIAARSPSTAISRRAIAAWETRCMGSSGSTKRSPATGARSS